VVESGIVTFDAHVHIMTHARLRSGWRWVRKFAPEGADLGPAPTPEEMTAGLRAAGITGYFNLFFPIFKGTSWEVNEWNDQHCRRHPGAMPLFSLHPEDSAEERDRLVEEFVARRGFAGLKIHSYIQNLRLDTPWLQEVYARLQQHRRILLVHSGWSTFYGADYSEEEMAAHLAAILEAFPGLTVIVAHMLYPRVDLAFQLLERYPNLLLDTTGVPTELRNEGTVEKWIPYFEQYSDRILFGSDYGVRAEPVAEVVRRLVTLPLRRQTLERIGGQNARRLIASLGIDRARERGEACGQADRVSEEAPRPDL